MRSERLLLGVVVGPVLDDGLSEVVARGLAAGAEVDQRGQLADVWHVSQRLLELLQVALQLAADAELQSREEEVAGVVEA